MDLAAVRAELPVLERLAYLNTGTSGPLPRRTVEAMTARLANDLAGGRSSREYWARAAELRDRLRAAFARLLNAPDGSIALTRSTTDGCNIVVAGLDLGPEDEIVTTDSEHPGLLGALHVSGARLRLARVSERPAAEALALLEAELSPRTRLIALSHVAWTTGQVLPVAELAGRGLPLLVDGAQAAGAIRVDVQALGCDFYAASGQKWLLGPDSTGFLYVRPEWVEKLRLTFPSYLSWEYPEYAPKATALRFEPGWASLAALAGVLASMAFAEEVGEDRFEAARTMAARCREIVGEQAELVTEPGQATLVTWTAEAPKELVRRLESAGVVVRDLPEVGWVRASCGYWTSDEDLERLAAGLILR